MSLDSFFKGKRVFITGHTGFKGSWLCGILLHFQAEVTGYSHKSYAMFKRCGFSNINTILADVRDKESLADCVRRAAPDIMIHMAAQPLVIDGYQNPHETYEINVMGTVNFWEAARCSPTVKAALCVTTDKVYRNNEWHWGYRENDVLDGGDPYSSSKSCAELVTGCYRRSFFYETSTAVATVRAGNVIGGGDEAPNRILPDCIRMAKAGQPIVVRNRSAIRPWQHVLDPLRGYLMTAKALYEGNTQQNAFNFGPNAEDCIPVSTLVDLFCSAWGDGARWVYRPDENAVHEATFLKLDCSMAKDLLDWHPWWNVRTAVEKTVQWGKEADIDNGAKEIMSRQISEYFEGEAIDNEKI